MLLLSFAPAAEKKQSSETKNEKDSPKNESGEGIGDVFIQVGKDIGEAGKSIGHTGKQAGKEIGSAFKDLGKGIKQAFSKDEEE